MCIRKAIPLLKVANGAQNNCPHSRHSTIVMTQSTLPIPTSSWMFPRSCAMLLHVRWKPAAHKQPVTLQYTRTKVRDSVHWRAGPWCERHRLGMSTGVCSWKPFLRKEDEDVEVIAPQNSSVSKESAARVWSRGI